MRLIGLAGWSGSGKTTLLTRVLPILVARGRTVSTLKHAHHSFEVDVPGKDSYQHRLAGAHEVLVSSEKRWALMHELRAGPEPRVRELVSYLSPVDLVIVEGFKSDHHPKLEVHRSALGQPFLHPNDPDIVALASDQRPESLALPLAGLDDVEAIATLIDQLARPYPV